VYSANAECDPETGQTTVSWQLVNNGETPVDIITTSADVPLEPNPVPAVGSASATMTLDGPDTDQQVATTVTIDDGSGQIVLSDDITAAACEGPEAPPDVSFTFTTTPSQSTALVGDTIEYSYCGTNTSTIPLEVVRVVDDRLGVVIELPSVETIVGPGESICNTDIGNFASYTVELDDAGSIIHNNAVVTVRTQETEPRKFQGTATSEVAVDLLRGLLGDEKDVRICHRTSSGTELTPLDPQNPNPYNPQDHNESSLIRQGHGNHEGPIWFPGIEGAWGDIIEPFEQSDGTQNPGYNWPEGEVILNNDCEIPGPPPTTTSTTTSTTSTTSTTVPDSTTSTTSTTVADSTTSTTSTTVPDSTTSTTSTTASSTTSTTVADSTTSSTSTTVPDSTTSTTSTTVADSTTSTTSTTTEPGSTTSLLPPPPGITFTFTNDPSVPTAEVGDTVEYSYCGENTSDVDLEVVRVVDDRYGTLEVPEEETILSPGETLCNTELGLPVTYVPRPADAGTTIVNNAVVTVRTVGAQPQAFQAADPAEVEILAAGAQVAPTTTTLPRTGLANTGASSVPQRLAVSAGMVASGWLIVVAARRRRTGTDTPQA
jgi:hypothetical protein